MNMTGKELGDLYNCFTESPERCQMPASLILLQTVRNTVERMQHTKTSVSQFTYDDRKVRSIL